MYVYMFDVCMSVIDRRPTFFTLHSPSTVTIYAFWVRFRALQVNRLEFSTFKLVAEIQLSVQVFAYICTYTCPRLCTRVAKQTNGHSHCQHVQFYI